MVALPVLVFTVLSFSTRSKPAPLAVKGVEIKLNFEVSIPTLVSHICRRLATALWSICTLLTAGAGLEAGVAKAVSIDTRCALYQERTIKSV